MCLVHGWHTPSFVPLPWPNTLRVFLIDKVSAIWYHITINKINYMGRRKKNNQLAKIERAKSKIKRDKAKLKRSKKLAAKATA